MLNFNPNPNLNPDSNPNPNPNPNPKPNPNPNPNPSHWFKEYYKNITDFGDGSRASFRVMVRV